MDGALAAGVPKEKDGAAPGAAAGAEPKPKAEAIVTRTIGPERPGQPRCRSKSSRVDVAGRRQLVRPLRK